MVWGPSTNGSLPFGTLPPEPDVLPEDVLLSPPLPLLVLLEVELEVLLEDVLLLLPLLVLVLEVEPDVLPEPELEVDPGTKVSKVAGIAVPEPSIANVGVSSFIICSQAEAFKPGARNTISLGSLV